MNRSRARYVAAFAPALLCLGCLGGDMDVPTWKPEEARYLFPPLKAGDRWTFAQWGADYSGASIELEILGDTVYEGDPAYIQTMTVKIPHFVTVNGTDARDYSQTGRFYLRKTDQEIVGEVRTTQASVLYPGTSVRTLYRENDSGSTSISGSLPGELVPGATWNWSAQRYLSSAIYFDDSLALASYDTLPRRRTYTASASEPVAVRAGTFDVIRIEWADSGSTTVSTGWFSKAARTMVRQIDDYGSSADTTELTDYSLE